MKHSNTTHQKIFYGSLIIYIAILMTCTATAQEEGLSDTRETLAKLLDPKEYYKSSEEDKKKYAERFVKASFGRDILDDALKSGDADLRERVTGILRYIPDEWAYQKLVDLALKDTSRGVRQSALYGLTFHRDKGSMKIIVQALNTDKDPYVRQGAALKLGNLHDEKGIEVLIKAFEEDKSYEVKYSCIEALGEIGNKKALPLLYSLLRKGISDPDHYKDNLYFFMGVTRALGKINSPDTPTEITKILLGDNQWGKNLNGTPEEIMKEYGTLNVLGILIIESGLSNLEQSWVSTVLDEVIQKSKDQKLIDSAKKVKDEIAKEQQRRKEEEQKKEKEEKK